MFIPTFVDLTSKDLDENRQKLLDANVQYPFGKIQTNLQFSKTELCVFSSLLHEVIKFS